eukprot:CAMPEP_0185765420 /NCGR_PEP_ID=MMETSP1174-20130828/29050_1 /TAXON_ID=35687 /ORGANISM="Dictyocha speculum, Strain CCMP1381" /LENGTH=60 /DNA_ID=CAMNT_0028448527 /DNA_START=176 /DNA_END=358 /DNA_ORIENTATION=+
MVTGPDGNEVADFPTDRPVRKGAFSNFIASQSRIPVNSIKPAFTLEAKKEASLAPIQETQ